MDWIHLFENINMLLKPSHFQFGGLVRVERELE